MHRILALILLCACASTSPPAMNSFTLTSPAFREGDTLSDRTVLNGLACNGPNLSPALEWRDAPAGTKSFALICDDYEARGGRRAYNDFLKGR